MKVVNIPTPILRTYGSSENMIEYLEPGILSSGLRQLQYLHITQEFWYCQITTEQSLQVFDIRELMGEDMFSRLLKKDLLLVIDLSFEPFYQCIDSIYTEVILKHNVPSTQIVFLSNMYDAEKYNKKISQKYQCDPIQVFWFAALEFMLRYDYHTLVSPKTLQSKKYNKKFLNFNRRWRPHRPVLTMLLYHAKLLDKGYVSFGPCESHSNWEKIWDWIKVNAIGNEELMQIVQSSEDIKHMPPLYLDLTDLNVNQVYPSEDTYEYYENSYFSVVSETTFFYRDEHQNSRFLTEKTFKAIKMCHPFILVSIPKSLEVLKHSGYKTFSPWIDESYDDEMDDNKRLLKIRDEIHRLCNLNEYELEEFLVAMRDICEYNLKLLTTKTKFISKLSDV